MGVNIKQIFAKIVAVIRGRQESTTVFEKLIQKALPGLAGGLKRQLLQQLTAVGKELLAAEIAKTAARAILKSVDTVIAIAVANLAPLDAEQLAKKYGEEVVRQVEQFQEAIQAYVPLQVAVEVAKQRHGATSPQASAARKKREVGMAEVREEVRDILQAAAGLTPDD